MASFSSDNIEQFFKTSHANSGRYVKAGTAGHLVRICLETGSRSLYIPLIPEGTEQESKQNHWESRGVECYISESPVADGKRYCVVHCAENKYFHLMNSMTAMVLDRRIIGADKAFDLFRDERSFWAIASQPITIERAAGLFGELYFIDRWLRGGILEVLRNRTWTGPDANDKDFSFDGLQIEVKITMSPRHPVRHRISSLHQLQADGRPLALFSLVAHPDDGGSLSLNDIVNKLFEELESEAPELSVEFQQLLESAGYVRGGINDKDFRFALPHGEGTLYAVKEDFPVMRYEDIDMDERVQITSYDIILSGVEHLQIGLQPPCTVEQISAAF